MIKELFIKLGLFCFICLGIVTFVLVNYGGNVDFFYEKFTAPKAKSMIIGDSRSMQGIQPGVMNKSFLDLDIELPMFNYSFTIAQAPIGPLYNKSIEKKLDPETKNGVFIISVTPWMFGSDKNKNNLAGEFREDHQPPHNMRFVSANPNYEYFIKNLNFFHFKGAFRKSSIMHKDGWLEENNLPKEQVVFDEWKSGQARSLNRKINEYKVSELRLKSLDTLIKKLNKHGKAYVVRMPIDQDFVDIENLFYKDFDVDMESVTKDNNIPYINFNNIRDRINFKTYDGHHLDKNSGQHFTKVLCDSILKYNKNTKLIE